MDSKTVTFVALHKNALIPRRHSEGAAGYDIHSVSSGSIPPLGYLSLKVGFMLRMPHTNLGIVLGRSGLARKYGLEVKNSYVKNGEEVTVNLYNNSNCTFVFEEKMRIAQLIFAKIENVEFHEPNEDDEIKSENEFSDE